MIRKAGSILLAAVMSVSMLGISGSTVLAEGIDAEEKSITEAAAEEAGGSEEAGRSEDPAAAEAAEGVLYEDEAGAGFWPGDRQGIPGDSFHIDRWEGHGWDQDGEFGFEITDVNPVSEGWRDVIEIQKGSGDESWWWDIYAKDCGIVTLKIEGGKENGEKISYNITLDIKEDVYGFEFMDTEEGRDHYLPGEEVTFVTKPFHRSSVPERDGDLSDVSIEWEIRGGSEFIRSLETVPAGNLVKGVASLSDLPEGQDEATIWLAPVMRDKQGSTMAEERGWAVSLMHEFSELYPAKIDSWMAPGSSEQVAVEMRDYAEGNPQGYDTRKNIEFRWYYDPGIFEILDAKGNRVGGRVGDYAESDFVKADPVTGQCTFTVRRLTGHDTEIVLMAVLRDQDNWHPIMEKTYWMSRINTDIRPEEHDVDVYTDDAAQRPVRIETGDLADNFDIECRVGFWEDEEWKGDLGTQYYTKEITDGRLTITLNKNYLDSLTEDTDIRVWAGVYPKNSVHSDENRLSETDAWFHVHVPRTEYYMERERYMLPGRDGHIEGTFRADVWNALYPYGQGLDCTVTNVEQIADWPADPEKGDVVKEFRPEGGRWYYLTGNMGHATFLVTYTDVDGTQDSYEFTIHVGTDVYYVDLYSADGSWNALPGGKLELVAYAGHEYIDENGGYHHDDKGETFDWSWSVVYGNAAIAVNEKDHSRATLQFADMPAGWNELHGEARAAVEILNDKGEKTPGYCEQRYFVDSEYSNIFPSGLDRDLGIGESIKDQKFEVREFVYGRSGYEVLDEKYGIKYEFHYDENILQITEKKNGADVKIPDGAAASGNTVTIKRLREGDTDLQVNAFWEAEYEQENRENHYYFEKKDITLFFDPWEGAVYDDYKKDFRLLTDNIAGILALPGARIEYEIGYWEGEGEDRHWVDCSDNRSLYSISSDRMTFTLYGAEMKKAGIWDVDVRGVLILNDEQLSEGGFRADLTEACVSHTWTETVVTPASRKANGKLLQKCSVCFEERETVIPKAAAATLSKTAFTYNGKVQVPSVSVKDVKGKTIAASNYTLDYSNKSSKNAGSYTVTVKYKNRYTGSQTLKYTIKKAANTLKVGKATRTADVKFKNKKSTKAKTVAGLKVINKGQGTITYKKVRVNKSAAQFTVNKKTGKITVKKGTKAGTYQVTVSAAAAGNKNYNSSVKKAVVTVKVK